MQCFITLLTTVLYVCKRVCLFLCLMATGLLYVLLMWSRVTCTHCIVPMNKKRTCMPLRVFTNDNPETTNESDSWYKPNGLLRLGSLIPHGTLTQIKLTKHAEAIDLERLLTGSKYLIIIQADNLFHCWRIGDQHRLETEYNTEFQSILGNQD